MSEKEINALDDALKLENNIKSFVEKCGIEALRTILNHVGFFEKVGILNPEEVDKNELEEQLKGLPLGNSNPVDNNLRIDKSSNPEEFGLYKDVLKRGDASIGDTSIYAQDPKILSKVEEDRISHPKLVPVGANIQEPMPSLFEDLSAHPKLTPVEPPAPVAMAEPEEEYVKLKKLILSQEETRQNNLWGNIGSPVAPGQIKFQEI